MVAHRERAVSTTAPTPPAPPDRAPLPTLESGDRLTGAEFHRRYLRRPDIKKAELVEGVVYVASPVRSKPHGQPHATVIGWLFAYCARTPGIAVDDNSTVFLDPDNHFQPDACLSREGPDGPRLDADGYIEGAPQLVVEVAASSASYDLHDKLRAYRRNGVREYVVWRVLDREVDWFRLREGAYVAVAPGSDGIIESDQFPGLRLDVPTLLAGDAAGVLAALDRPAAPASSAADAAQAEPGGAASEPGAAGPG